MSIVKLILERSPWLEILFRRFYYLLKENNIYKNNNKVSKNNTPMKSDFSLLKDYLLSLGIKNGDILIVHSSYDQLKHFDVNPIIIINFLRELIGDTGTLVFPAFYVKKSMDALEGVNIDLNRKVCSTGIMPSLFLRMEGVIRSSFPENSLAAQGPKAEAMFERNMDIDLAHGIGSSWHFCYENDAKVLLLGTNASKTLTMVHVAEDVLDEAWPINHWYEEKIVSLKENNNILKKKIRVRRQFWSRFMASEFRTAWLKNNNLLTEKKVEGVNIAYVHSSRKLVSTLINNMMDRKISFFRPPSKYWKTKFD